MKNLSANLRGILFMVGGMLCFTFGDLFVKLASERLPSGQVMIALGGGCAVVFIILLKRAGQPLMLRAFFEPSVLLRNSGEVLGAVCMFIALAFSPLSTVTAIIQTLPLLLTLSAALFLGEKVGIHRIAAVVIGFVGVLIVIRPGMSDFDQYSLITLLAVVGMAMRDIGASLTRPGISSLQLSFYSALTLLLTGSVMSLLSGGLKVPDLTASAHLVGLVVAASFGLIMVTQSVRIAEISVVSPFRYVRLPYGMALGMLVLGETVDAYTIVGSLITLLAGIYIWVRENRVAVS